MAKQGKRIRKAYESVEAGKVYPLAEALKLIKSGASAKFDETVDIAVNLGVDPKQSDQAVRGAVAMPAGLGKTVRVAVFAKGDKAEEAKKAGADIVGAEDLMEAIQKGEMNFDRCIATPDMMALVGQLGKILGPKGLMPNPKLGTVTPDVKKAVEEAKGGAIEYRAEKAGIVQARVGKASFDDKKLTENIVALVREIIRVKPPGAKGTYMKKVTLSSTMGPGIKIDLASFAQDRQAA